MQIGLPVLTCTQLFFLRGKSIFAAFRGEIEIVSAQYFFLHGVISCYFSVKKRLLFMEKKIKWGNFFTCTVYFNRYHGSQRFLSRSSNNEETSASQADTVVRSVYAG